MKTHKFARKPFYVDAVRVSEENMEEVAEWCDGKIVEHETDGKFVSVKVHRPLTERQTQAFVGDWVLNSGNGFKVYVQKAFDKSFEKVKHLTKAQADEAGIRPPIEPKKRPKKGAFRPPANPVLSKEAVEKIKASTGPKPVFSSAPETFLQNETKKLEEAAAELATKPPVKDDVDAFLDEVARG